MLGLLIRIILYQDLGYKRDINTGKGRCCVSKHFLTKCADVVKLRICEVYLVEQVEERDYDVEGKLC